MYNRLILKKMISEFIKLRRNLGKEAAYYEVIPRAEKPTEKKLIKKNGSRLKKKIMIRINVVGCLS